MRLLRCKSKFNVKVNKEISEDFQTTVGTFEGDSRSVCLFKLTFAAALSHVRAPLQQNNPPITNNGMPNGTEYADDVDFLDEDMQT